MASYSWGKGIVNKTPAMEQEDKVQNVQARIIQQQYVRAAVKEINNPTNKERMVGLSLDKLAKDLHDPKIDRKKKWTERFQNEDDIVWKQYERMQKHLQASRLTINFQASSWFSKPNEYPGYTQMYERGVKKIGDPLGNAKEMRIKDSAVNTAKDRNKADTKATFTKEGLKSNESTFEALKRIMDTGGLNAVAGTTDEFTAKNPYFNPKSKQVFAALDYGFRPHGACIYYGMSFMVLKPKFMTNAIYFASDTFVNKDRSESAGHAMNRVSYDMMGALYGQAEQKLKEDLHKSCVLGQKLQDPSNSLFATSWLLEAHLFEPLNFSGNIEAIYLSPRDQLSSEEKYGTEWTDIRQNASAFAKAHGAQLIFVD